MDGLQIRGVLKAIRQNEKLPDLMNVLIECSRPDGSTYDLRGVQFRKEDRATYERTALMVKHDAGDLTKLYEKRVVIRVAATTYRGTEFVNLEAASIEGEPPPTPASRPVAAAS